MVLGLSIAVGFVVALIFGGSPKRLSTLGLKRIALFYVAICIQLVVFPLSFMPWSVGDGVAKAFWLASYAVLIFGALANIRITGVPLITAGMLSNVAAVVANGGSMPALPRAVHAAFGSYKVHDNGSLSASPHLPWLVDRWAVPHWVHVGNVYSVGDVVIAAGVIVLLFAAMGATLGVRRPQPVSL